MMGLPPEVQATHQRVSHRDTGKARALAASHGHNVEPSCWLLCRVSDTQSAACLETRSFRLVAIPSGPAWSAVIFRRVEVEPLRLLDCPVHGPRTDRPGTAAQ
jgi:hypothetical protein